MSPVPIQIGAAGIDLSPRVFKSEAVVASPAAAAETIICSVVVGGDLSTALGVVLLGWATYTVGTNGVSILLKLRRTDASGATVAATGADTAVATNLGTKTILGVDDGQVAARQVYVLTMTVASGSAETTVSAAAIVAIAV